MKAQRKIHQVNQSGNHLQRALLKKMGIKQFHCHQTAFKMAMALMFPQASWWTFLSQRPLISHSMRSVRNYLILNPQLLISAFDGHKLRMKCQVGDQKHTNFFFTSF